MANDADNPYATYLTIFIIAASAAALVVLIYHFATICCNSRIRRRPPPAPPQQQQGRPSSSLDASVAELIPAHKYRTSDDCGGCDNTCAVCLCEFEDGEELRTLPECGHSFHANCIDMWLYSHFTCPVCRTDNTPSPLVLRRLLECSRSGDRIEGRSMGAPQ